MEIASSAAPATPVSPARTRGLLMGIGLSTGMEFYTFDSVNLVLPDVTGTLGLSASMRDRHLLSSVLIGVFAGMILSGSLFVLPEFLRNMAAPSAASSGVGQVNAVVPESTARIIVKVALDPKLKDSVQPSDTLFVFAKAARRPPMPLAITRLTAAHLPASLTLSASTTTAQTEPAQLVIAERVD